MSDDLEVEFEGKSYTVTYSVANRMITVYAGFGSKSTQVGGSPPGVLARIIGRELLEEAKKTGLL